MSNVLLQVNAKYEDRSALHQAAQVGNFTLVKLLLEFGANVEIEVGVWISQKEVVSVAIPHCRFCL